MTQNLWGSLPNVDGVRPPYALLKEQADHLREMTQGLLYGEISQRTLTSYFILTFGVKAPALNNYFYELFTVTHDIDLYPARIETPDGSVRAETKDEIELTKVIADILKSSKTQRVIAGLLAQLKAVA
jgi:hypothetical protein